MLLGGIDASGGHRPHEIVHPYLTGHAEITPTIGVVKHCATKLGMAIAQRRGLA